MAEPTVRGRFVWYELMTKDEKAAVPYYQKVVGWQTQAWEQDKSYQMWLAKSGPIGGVASLPAGGGRPHWLGYIGCNDIDATCHEAVSLGGKLVVPITDVGNGGRYAVLADPQGAIFGVYWSAQSVAKTGMPQLGEFSWHELTTTDYQAAFAFYQKLFGWQKTDAMDMGALGVYFMFGLDGQSMGGMFNKQPDMPLTWCYYVQVPDVHKAAKAAIKAGGKVINGPMQVPGGSWIAQMIDPQGVLHAVVSTDSVNAAGAATKTKPTPAKKKVAAKRTAQAKLKQTASKKSSKKKPAKKAVKKKLTKKTLAKKTRVKVAKKASRKVAAKRKSSKQPFAAKRMSKKKAAKKRAIAKRRTTPKRKNS